MSDRSVNGYMVRVEQADRLGALWVVRVFRKRFLFRKTVSSDWFLDGAQAKLFADEIARDLGSGRGFENLLNRRPGWTLYRPEH
jgi:hypothetical protein